MGFYDAAHEGGAAAEVTVVGVDSCLGFWGCGCGCGVCMIEGGREGG